MQDADHKLTDKANEHFSAGRTREAEKLYRKMLADEPENPQVLFMLAQCRRREDDPEQTLELLRRAAAIDDNNPLMHTQLGRQYLEMGQVDAGRESLLQGIALNPNDVQARTLLGMSYLNTEQPERAESELRTALRARQDYVPGRVLLALSLLEQDKLDEAAEEAGTAARQQPTDAGAQSVLGRVMLAQGHAAFAEQCFRNGLRHHSQNLELKAGLARALIHQGQYAEALSELEAVLQGGLQVSETIMDYTRALAAVGRGGEAHELIERVASEVQPGAPDYLEAITLLAEIRLTVGDARGALDAINRLDPVPDALAVVGASALLTLSETERAVEQLQALLQSDQPDVARQARLMLAEFRLEQGEDDDVEALLQPLLVRTPPDRGAAGVRLRQLRRMQDWRGTEQLLKALLENERLAPEERKRLHVLLAVTLDQAGDRTGATAWLEQGADWQHPEIVERYDAPEFARVTAAWEAADDAVLARLAAMDDAGSEQPPVFLLGWPGSGRMLVLEALAAHPAVAFQPMAGIGARMGSLGPARDPDGLLAVEAPAAAIAARRYRKQSAAGGLPLEPAWLPVCMLPLLARVFPGARVIAIDAAEGDLHLHLVMTGQAQPLELLAHHRRETALFTRLAKALPLEIIPVRRKQLMEEPEAALRKLTDKLGLDWHDYVLDAYQDRRERQPYWPDGHWRHYAEFLGRD